MLLTQFLKEFSWGRWRDARWNVEGMALCYDVIVE